MEFFATFFLPVPVTVWSALPDVKVRDREDGSSTALMYFLFAVVSSFKKRVVDDANVPIRQACSAL